MAAVTRSEAGPQRTRKGSQRIGSAGQLARGQLQKRNRPDWVLCHWQYAPRERMPSEVSDSANVPVRCPPFFGDQLNQSLCLWTRTGGTSARQLYHSRLGRSISSSACTMYAMRWHTRHSSRLSPPLLPEEIWESMVYLPGLFGQSLARRRSGVRIPSAPPKATVGRTAPGSFAFPSLGKGSFTRTLS